MLGYRLLWILLLLHGHRLPTVLARRDGGVMFRYEPVQAAAALVLVGGVDGRCARLKRRAAYEACMQQALGTQWRCGWWGDGGVHACTALDLVYRRLAHKSRGAAPGPGLPEIFTLPRGKL